MTNETTLDINSRQNKWYRLMLFQWRKSFGGWMLMATTALTALFIVYQLFSIGNAKQIAFFADTIQAILSICVVILAFRVIRHPSIDAESKKAWWIVTFSFLFYSFGHILWFYFSSILGVEPFPSLADVGFWMFYPLMFIGLLSFPTAKTSGIERLKFSMDVFIVLLGGTTAAWHFIIRPTIESVSDGEWLMTALNLSYILGDLVLLLGISTVLLRTPAKVNKVALFTIVFGLINTAISDIGFAAFTLNGTYASGHWIDSFFITGLLIFLAACHFQFVNLSKAEHQEVEVEQEITGHKFSWLPYLAIAVVFGVLLFEIRPYWKSWLGITVFASVIITVLVVLRQITAVKENVKLLAEQAKRQSEIKFRTLVENSSDLITIIDLKGRFVYQSPSFEKILGYENDELVGKDSLKYAHQDEVESVINDFKILRQDTNAVVVREYKFRHKNGSWRILESIAKTVVEEDKQFSGIILNLRDVTERREAENKLRAFTTKLEQSNRELQDFAYVASHDLQEPLRKVQAFGDRLDRKYSESLNDEARDYIKRMRDASARMQNLINDLLAFSRITTKAKPFEKVSLNTIAEEVVSDLEVRIEQEKAVIEIGNLPEIDADALQIRQLLQNLIGNALKFHRPEQSPNVKIYAEDYSVKSGGFQLGGEEIHTTTNSFQINGAGERVCKLVVEDNGIGFEEKYLDRIFTVFQRLHGRSEYEGSGVGLAVCRKIVERHNGTITARSESGKGAKFIISLPMQQNIGETNNEHF